MILNGVYSIIIIERGKNCKNALGDLLSQRVLNFLQRFCSEKPRALRIQAVSYTHLRKAEKGKSPAARALAAGLSPELFVTPRHLGLRNP